MDDRRLIHSLIPRFDPPLHVMANRATLTELEEATFALTQGARIPAEEVSGMAFWWLKEFGREPLPWRAGLASPGS